MSSPDASIGREEGQSTRSRKGQRTNRRKAENDPPAGRLELSPTTHPANLFLRSREPRRIFANLPGFAVALLVAAFLCFPASLHAQLNCLACHGQPGMKNAAGHSISVPADTFHASVHGSLPCTACHTDIKTFPHPVHIEPVHCATCHASQAAGVTGSVHAAASTHPCLSCHGNPHAIVPVTNPRSPVYPLNVPRTCGTCHGNAALARKHHLKNVYAEYVDSIHGLAVTKDGLLVAANCSSCHGTHHILSHTDPKSPTYRTNIPKTCGKCHAGIEAKYLAGSHGKAMAAGNQKAPVCTDCHTAHRIVQPQQAAFQEKTVGTCGGCHREKYTTYRDTFHAQVSALGYTEVAHCWDCHGPHEVLPASDPQSPINKANLVKTCGKCHADANVRFVSYEPHANPYDFHSNPALYSIRLFMTLLLWSVLGFFALHTILWFTRSKLAQRRRTATEEKDHE